MVSFSSPSCWHVPTFFFFFVISLSLLVWTGLLLLDDDGLSEFGFFVEAKAFELLVVEGGSDLRLVERR